MEGDGERPAMSSLTVHWAAHVSTIHPSSASRTHRRTGSLLMAFYIHHFPHNPRLHACTANASTLPLLKEAWTIATATPEKQQ